MQGGREIADEELSNRILATLKHDPEFAVMIDTIQAHMSLMTLAGGEGKPPKPTDLMIMLGGKTKENEERELAQESIEQSALFARRGAPQINEMMCYNCKGYGHKAADCKEPKQGVKECGFCRKKGHTEAECFKKHPHLQPTQEKEGYVGFSIHNFVG